MGKSINIDILSKYRTPLMGFATIMILCCHAESNGVAMSDSISWLLQWGNYGVDIFLLLSGLGLYYSLRNTSSLSLWYKKRYARILIPYAIISCGYYVYYCVVNNLDVVDYVLLISTIGYWTDHIGAWFVALLIPLYAITPIYDKLFEKVKYKGLFTVVSVIILSVITSIKTDNAIALNVEFAVSRMPAFLLGYYIGYIAYNKKSIGIANLLLILIGCIILYLLYENICPNINRAFLLVIPMVAIIAIVVKLLKNLLAYLGEISLESYLFNIYLGYILNKSFPLYADVWGYIIIVFVGIILSVMINKIAKFFINTYINRRR